MKSFFFLFLFSLSSLTLLSQSLPVDSIPFLLSKDQRIYTQCRVNGGDTLLFLVDTGASDMVINSRSLPKVKMLFNETIANKGTTGNNEVSCSSENSLSWGRQEIEGLRFIALPYSEKELDGVLGLSVLRRFCVEIDYGKRIIYLYEKDTFIPPKGEKGYRLTYKYGIPFITLSLSPCKGKRVKASLAVDTGSDRIIDLSFSFVERMNIREKLPSPFAFSRITSSDGNYQTIHNIFFPEVTLSRLTYIRIPGGYVPEPSMIGGLIHSPGVDGMIGNMWLKRFNQLYDFKNDKLYLRQNDLLYSPFYEFLVQ